VDATLLRPLFRHPSLMVLEELHLVEARYAYAPLMRDALAHRPPSLRRIVARGVRALEPLVREIPGLEV
jgi:hypothetical protein